MTTFLRRRLARIIEPMPDKGEIWCNDCELNYGETLVLHESVAIMHLTAHKDRLHDPRHKNETRAYVNMIGRGKSFGQRT